MVEGHSWGGASRKGSNHPPPTLRRRCPSLSKEGSLSRAQVEVFRCAQTRFSRLSSFDKGDFAQFQGPRPSLTRFRYSLPAFSI